MSTELLSCEAAFLQARREINAECEKQGIAGLSGHDVPIIAAHVVFEKAYRSVVSTLPDDKREQFNADVVTYAKKLIAHAILVP